MKYLSLIIISFPCYLPAQELPRKDYDLEKLAGEIFAAQDLDLNYSELYENLAQILSNPLDINKVSADQLRSLFVLNEKQVNSFINYREKSGPFLSIYELQVIPDWNQKTLDRILPFVVVQDPSTKLNSSIFNRISKEKNHYLVVRYERSLESRKGYEAYGDSAHRYLGSPDKVYLRYRVSRPGDFSLGFTMEKDPGEPLVWSPQRHQYGFDFLSWHAQVQDKGKIKNLIAGDFQCQFGQGLILGSVYGFGKNSETITTVRRSNLGFLPYTSIDESLFMRGLAASYSLLPWLQVHGFFSTKLRDGVAETPEQEDSFVSSLSTTGLHRTFAEIQSRKQIRETDVGLVVQIQNKHIDAGLILHTLEFGQPIVPNQNAYNQYATRGKIHQNAGLYLNYTWANMTFFSELAATKGHGFAGTAGLLGNFTDKLDMALLLRSFSADFHSFYANSFSENTSPQNEQGLYWGGKYTVDSRYSVSAYVDLFRFPWLRYRIYSPSEGHEWLVRINYTPSKTVSLFLQAREEKKDRNLSLNDNLYHTAAGVKRNFWVNCDYTASSWMAFKTRIQGSQYNLGGKTSHGIAFIQDMTVSMKRWSLSVRYALFDTEDYDNRQYSYEKDVWLSYSMLAYEGVGIKNYVLLHYTLSQKIDCWIRWSQVRYSDRSEIGSGADRIEGNSRNDIKFQARIRI